MTNYDRGQQKMRTFASIVAASFAVAGCASSQAAQPASEPQTDQPTTAKANPPPPAAQAEPAPAPPAQADTQREPMMGEMAKMCPMRVQGTTVRAEDAPGGAALLFTTSSDVTELRRRVAKMADMHNQHPKDGGMMMHRHMMGSEGMQGGGMHGAKQGDTSGSAGRTGMQGGGMHGGDMQGSSGMQGGGMMMPPSEARVEDVDGGARLVLTARDPAQQEPLAQHVRKMAEKMTSHQCPMMTSDSTSPAPPTSATPEGESHDQ